MKFEPEAIVRAWAIDVDVGDTTYTIPALPASEWLLPVASQSYLDIVPGMLEDPSVLDDELIESDDTGVACESAARAAIASAAGCPWWSAQRLCASVIEHDIAGELTLKGVDPTRLSLGGYLAAAYRLLTRYQDEAKRAQLDMSLDQPPTNLPAEEWYDEQAAADGFMAAMAASQ